MKLLFLLPLLAIISVGEDGIRTHDLLTASQVYLFDSSMIWFF